MNRASTTTAGRFLAGIAIGAVCVYFITRRVDWRALCVALWQANPWWVLSSAVLSLAAFGVAGLRWRRLVDRHVRLSKVEAFESLMAGNFTNLVMPTRLGDVMRAVLVARRGDAPVSLLLASIVVERVADVLMLLVLVFLLSTAFTLPAPIAVAVWTLAAATAAGIVLFLLAADRIVPLFRTVLACVAPRLVQAVGGPLDRFILELRAAGGGGRVRGVMLLSALAWTLWGLAACASVRAFGLPVPWYGGFFVMAVVNLGGIVPASPGAIGIYHYLAILALSVWVHDSVPALAFAIVSHIIGLAVVVGCGLVSLARQGLPLRSLSVQPAVSRP